ncbi:MAG: hypothetical protein QG608_2204 [Actinomycetota bacterium]|nr:hypothetical protein [Actinomycetota bacterium]
MGDDSAFRAAVVPHPPLLVPDLVGTGPGTEPARRLLAACDRAVRFLLDPPPARVVVVGTGRADITHDRTAWGTLAGFGVDVRAPAGPAAAAPPGEAPTLPLSLTLGSWLLDRAAWSAGRLLVEVGPGAEVGLGAAVAHGPCPWPARHRADAWLVLGDPGPVPAGPDGQADPLPGTELGLLRSPDPTVVLAPDPEPENAAVRQHPAPWRILARALREEAPRRADIRAHLLYDAAPYGVPYHVSTWLCRPQGPSVNSFTWAH